MRSIIVVALLGALLAACGGGDASGERVLKLRTGDYSEARLRAEIRSEGVTETMCEGLKGLSPRDVLDILDVQFEEEPERVIQTPDPDDDLRQAEILLEECRRITS